MTYRFKPIPARRVAIVGSRHITDYRTFAATVRPLLQPSDVIVSGGADGIDSLAARYARQNHHPLVVHPVDMTLVKQKELEGLERRAAYAHAANHRNQLIVDDSDVMLAVMCDHSRGTPDSLRRMRTKLGIDTRSTDLRVVSWLWDCGRP